MISALVARENLLSLIDLFSGLNIKFLQIHPRKDGSFKVLWEGTKTEWEAKNVPSKEEVLKKVRESGLAISSGILLQYTDH